MAFDGAHTRKKAAMLNFCQRMGRRLDVWITVLALAAACPAAAADLPIYTDGLTASWSDWSWGSTRNAANNSPTHSGNASFAVTITTAWAALYLHASPSVGTSGYTHLQFWIHGGSAGNQQLRLVANNAQSVAVTATAGTWTQVTIPLTALGSPANLTDLYWQDDSGAPEPTFYLDDIVLVAGAALPPGVGPALSIDVNADRHAISDDIYGVNQVQDEALATQLRLPVRRWGGNSVTRYNWQNDTFNTASDYYYQNIPNDNANPAALPDGSASDKFVEQDRRTGTRSLITVPTIGWVAKRRTAGHPYDCGFSVAKYGAQQSTDPYDPDCGNGMAPNGTTRITGNDPLDTSVAIGPGFVANWVNHLVARYGSAANGGVAYYAMDNEPGIWNGTHRDVHPLPTTYNEIRDLTYLYGAAIKAADPSAKTLGPVEDGWCRYIYSAADNCSPNGADFLAHGSVPYVAWYLQQMKLYEQQHALRILDYFDLHYYPAQTGVSLQTAGSAATQALRLRSTRSLWDPAYIDESWISDLAQGGVAVKLIPRMKQWNTDNYPGTRTAISEYNWGGLESINGALAQADVLGIFGREGLDLATLWGDLLSAQPGSFAFRIYRNYDGAGRGFGETAVRAASVDQGALSVYAAQDSGNNALTIMVINKSTGDLTSSIALAGFNPQASAAVYRYSPANLAAIVHAADQPVTPAGFSATFPANSITLFVLAPASNAPGAPTGVNAAPGDGQATITFVPPASDGGSAITGYLVICSGGIDVLAQMSPVSVTGLVNDTPYSCYVTATNANGTGPPSASVDVTPSAMAPIVLVAVQSRKTHAAAGTHDLRIDATQMVNGAVSVEPRAMGAGHTIVFQFNVPVSSFGTVTAADTVSGAVSNVASARSGKEILVTLTGIADNRRITIGLTGVTGPVDSTNASAAMGFLVGDVNGTRSVNAADIAAVKANNSKPVNSYTYRFDLDAQGTITSSDISAVKARAGWVLVP
ncbi:MAG: glycoside hydrolase family 44 protein [Betaproteobacteria bacterium]